jgi:ferric-dicitrate binding protein FerR (iron transport regulator)
MSVTDPPDRTAIPPDRAARVAMAAKAHWRAELRRTTRRRWAVGAIVAAAAIIAIGVRLLPRDRASRDAAARVADVAPVVPTAPAARVEVVSDAAWLQVSGRESPTPLRVGDRIAVGAEVGTASHGRVALRLSTGHSVRLDTGTRLRMIADRTLALDAGAVYVDSRRLASDVAAPAESIEIKTPLGTIRDVGTQFEVRWLPTSLRVRVREGRVAFAASGIVVNVAAGQEVERHQDHAVASNTLTPRPLPAGAALDWIGGITPMPDIDGRSLQSFLAWLAHERGLRLVFATPETAAAAPGIVLKGSIAGMTLDQALDSVLMTCRLSSRIEGDVLRIDSSTSKPAETP